MKKRGIHKTWWKTIAIFLGAILFLTILIIFFQTNIKIQACKFSEGLQADNCLSELSFQTKDMTPCQYISDQIIRDACYLDFANNNVMVQNKLKKTCIEIEDPRINYMCNRLRYRPHMNTMLTRKDSIKRIKLPKSLNECNKYNFEDYLVCNFIKTNSESYKEDCENLKITRFVDECKYYYSLSLIPRLEKDSNTTKAQMLKICDEMSSKELKSECIYTVADELAKINNKKQHIHEVYSLCHESNAIKDYHCTDHVSEFMKDPLFISSGCKEMSNMTEKMICYMSLGSLIITRENYLETDIISRCQQIIKENNDTIREEVIDLCISGASKSFGNFLAKDNLQKDLCYSEGIDSRNCLNLFFDKDMPEDVNKQIKICKNTVGDERKICVESVISFIAIAKVFNPSEMSFLCNQFSGEEKENCFMLSISKLNFYFNYLDDHEFQKKCDSIESELSKFCAKESN